MNPPVTAGRIVLYSLPEESPRKGETRAAIVTSSWDGANINLLVQLDQCDDLPDSGGRYYPTHRVWSAPYDQSGKPGTWRWMDYQLGQAAKATEVQTQLLERLEQSEQRITELQSQVRELNPGLAPAAQAEPAAVADPAPSSAPIEPSPAEPQN